MPFPPASRHVSSMWCESVWGVKNETTWTGCWVRQRKTQRLIRTSTAAIWPSVEMRGSLRSHPGSIAPFHSSIVSSSCLPFSPWGSRRLVLPNTARMFLTSHSGGMFMSSRVFSWRGEEKVKWKKKKKKRRSGNNYVSLNSSSGVTGVRTSSPTALLPVSPCSCHRWAGEWGRVLTWNCDEDQIREQINLIEFAFFGLVLSFSTNIYRNITFNFKFQIP